MRKNISKQHKNERYNRKIYQIEGEIHHAKHIIHKATRLQREYNKKMLEQSYAFRKETTDVKRASIKKYFKEHPDARKQHKAMSKAKNGFKFTVDT